jgi:hypothetical protein
VDWAIILGGMTFFVASVVTRALLGWGAFVAL